MSSQLAISSDLFRAFADPTRLRLLNLLLERELCVCELCELLGEIQPKISRHLAYLRRAGLVNVRRVGKWKHYSICPEPGSVQRTLLACVRTCLRATEDLRADLARLRSQDSGPCCEV